MNGATPCDLLYQYRMRSRLAPAAAESALDYGSMADCDTGFGVDNLSKLTMAATRTLIYDRGHKGLPVQRRVGPPLVPWRAPAMPRIRTQTQR